MNLSSVKTSNFRRNSRYAQANSPPHANLSAFVVTLPSFKLAYVIDGWPLNLKVNLIEDIVIKMMKN